MILIIFFIYINIKFPFNQPNNNIKINENIKKSLNNSFRFFLLTIIF